ncbi:copper fist DNA binding domain-containing protein [Helicostylum pulchrum]|nr:copper fist DNA binding domain-containing protein [Helicostylum pulchrum]
MLINGEKWACETCIKGHRATHCKHTDRQLVPIKKKGRPSTQCKRCRELRIVRQLHVKCNCEDQSQKLKKKKEVAVVIKKKTKVDTLRPIAPKQIPKEALPVVSCCKKPVTVEIIKLPDLPTSCCKKPTTVETVPSPSAPPKSCCKKIVTLETVPLPNIPPPSSCCGPPSKNQQGETIRVVTCRCGDSCACIGCDAHPSRAMKEGKKDVYIGFDNQNNNRRLSIAAICSSNPASEMDHPSSVLSQDGILLCGCGCAKTFEDCSGCFNEICQSAYL